MTAHALPAETAHKLQKLSRIGQGIALLSIAGLVAYGAYLVFTPEELRAVLNRGLPGSPNDPPVLAFAAAAALGAVPSAIFIAILWLVRRLFQRVSIGRFLDNDFVRIMRQLGWLALASGIASLFTHSAVSMLMTLANPPGQRMLLIEISSAQVAALIMGLLFFMFTHVFAEMTRIDEDNRSII